MSQADIFNPVASAQYLNRARKRRAKRKGLNFLYSRCVEDIAERLLDVNREFSSVLICAEPEFVPALRARLAELTPPPSKSDAQTRLKPAEKLQNITPFSGPLSELCEESSDILKTQRYDLILSVLNLHRVNALPELMIKFNQALRPDGLFIGSMFGGQTLTQLRHALYETDDTCLEGICARIAPMANISQIASLLNHARFTLPVIDRDLINVRYKDLKTLVSDLRDLGESNALSARQKTYLSKSYLSTLERVYTRAFATSENKLKASFDILWMTGWAQHPDQPKPLRPGSAKMRLSDALGVKEMPLKP